MFSLDHPPSHNLWAAPPLHIPNRQNQIVKTELTVFRRWDAIHKWNWWHLPDDVGERVKPHNHPWDFTSSIHHGELTEVRYTKKGSKWYEEVLTHLAGHRYYMKRNEYHVVIAIAPGTVTEMHCTNLNHDGSWGYLDIENGFAHIPAEKDPEYERLLRENNRWMQ